MSEYRDFLIYQLIFTKNEDIITLNKGLLGNTKLGIFEMVGYNKANNRVLLYKPNPDDPRAVNLVYEMYKKECQVLAEFQICCN